MRQVRLKARQNRGGGGGKRGRLVGCTVRTGCESVMTAGVVDPWGLVCREK